MQLHEATPSLRRPIIALLLVLLSALAVSAVAEESSPPSSRPLYIIFDGSNSMWGELPNQSRKIAVAKDVFRGLEPSLFANREVALSIYGHRRAGDCADIELAVPLGPASEALPAMADRIDGVTPRGKTPITRSLRAAREELGERQADILLISDGIETCDADPCDLVQEWRDSGVELRVYVVGLGLTDVARGAMQCIADAAGTAYLDASSAAELGDAIEQAAASEPPDPGEAAPRPQSPGSELRISGQDSEGNYLPVSGILTSAAGESADVSSNGRFVFEGGSYVLVVGVPTVNGVTYEPVTTEVTVKETGTTRIVVTVPRPPQVTTRFIADGQDVAGPMAKAYVDGREVFGLRPREEHFVLPGTYELRAKLNQDNDLRITETIEVGDSREIVFEATKTVRVKIVVKPQGMDRGLRQHQELLRDGEVAYRLHYNNGGDVRPGVYDVRSESDLTPYLVEDVEIGDEDPQVIELTVPFAIARVEYVFRNEPPPTDLRCWLERVDEQGDRLARSGALQCDGEDVILVEGRYRVRVWTRLGEFEDTEFDAVLGEPTAVEVREK